MINTVFLDLDGVIANFQKAVCDKFELPYPPREYNFFEAIRDEVNDFCTFDFWQFLEWMHDGRDILRAIMDTVGLEKVFFPTGMMPNVETATGKMRWLKRNLPIYLRRVILTGLDVPKSLLARPDALLIDDKNENVDEFVSAGGQGILVPRPWNRAYEQSDISANVVRESLEKLI